LGLDVMREDGTSAYPQWRDVPMVRAWEGALRRENWSIDSLRPLNVLGRQGGGEHAAPSALPLFALLEARGTDPEGKPLLPYVLLRGSASVVVPVCINRDTGARRFLMIHQRRVGNGALSLEFPAGMIDGNDDPSVTALRELEEETGVRADPSALVPLWDKGLCSSPGLSDEAVYFFAAEITLDDAAFHALEGGAAGHAHEGEHITTTLKTFAEAAPEITSLQPMLGFFLYQARFGTQA
jgi:ADP-sugar diphosphatase